MKNLVFSVVIIGIMFSMSCSSTYLATSWKEPNKQVKMNALNKVLVVALFKNETNRHKAEDEMVSYLGGKGIVSYNYLNAGFNLQSENEMRNKIRADGFDGAVTMRLLDVDKEQYFSPGNPAFPSYYNSFSGYYYRKWSYLNSPNYFTTTKIFTVETNIYSIKEDRIIWSGITKTTDPSGVDKMTNEIGNVIYKKMIKEGFIKK